MPSRSRTKFSEYIRRNAIALVALFFAVSGSTAMALDGSNTVFSDDIAPQEVTTADLAQASVTSGKLAASSVNSGRVADDSLTSEDILDGEIQAIDVAFGTLRGDEIQDGTLGGNDVADNSVHGEDIDESTIFNDNSLTAADLADGSIGKGELSFNAVGADELGEFVNREDPTPPVISGGTAHNGAYNFADSDVTCNADEELIGASARWSPTDGTFEQDDELFVRSVFLNHAAENAIVAGGNDSGDDYRLVAVATCLQP